MSLLATLAYAITAAVRPRVRDAEVAALQAQIDDLNRQAFHARARRAGFLDLNRHPLYIGQTDHADLSASRYAELWSGA